MSSSTNHVERCKHKATEIQWLFFVREKNGSLFGFFRVSVGVGEIQSLALRACIG